MFGNPCFCLKNRVFWPKNRNLFPNLFPNYFCKIFASSKRPDISEKFPNFGNRTILKTKSLENSVFCRALIFMIEKLYSSQEDIFAIWREERLCERNKTKVYWEASVASEVLKRYKKKLLLKLNVIRLLNNNNYSW